MKLSARITRGKHFNTYSYYDIEVTANTLKQAEEVCERLIDTLLQELNDYNASFVGCCWNDQHDSDKYIYGDSIAIDYERGLMQDIHKDIMQIWKNVKKQFM